MRGDIIAVRNIRYDGYEGPRLPPKVQLQRLRKVIEQELTLPQREILIAYYFQEKTMSQIAADRGINKSTVCRTLRRAEERVRRCLRY